MCVHVLCIQLFFASKGGWSIFCIVHPCITEEIKIILKEREREREIEIAPCLVFLRRLALNPLTLGKFTILIHPLPALL